MTEWLKVHAWKVCIPQKGIASSNLAFSALRQGNGEVAASFFPDSFYVIFRMYVKKT